MAKSISSATEKRFPRVQSGSQKPNQIDGKMSRIPYNEIPIKDRRVTAVITKRDYEYFRARALEGLLSNEEKEACLMKAEREKERLLAESIARKEEIRQLDMRKHCDGDKKSKVNELEAEARARTMNLLERANNLKLEREEEIQMCNRLILETKCRAIRDVQVAEKKLIEKELSAEEKRLNNIMEAERRKKIEEENRKIEEEAARRRTFVRLLKTQIMENEEQRIVEFERKQEEGRLINLSNIAWQDEELSKLKKKKSESALLRRQFIEENEKLIKYKEIEREENRRMDMRIREFQKKQQEREVAQAEAQRKIEARKYREKERVAKQAMQTHDVQAQIDELNALRIKEEVEREWRRKEKEEALNRLETRRRFADARQEQIKCRKTLQAMEIERDRREFEAILAAQKQALCREEKKREERQRVALKYREEILKQMDEKDKNKIEERRKMFEEGMAIRGEIEMRAKKLRDAMVRKCQEMRENKVPEIYINDVKSMIEKIK